MQLKVPETNKTVGTFLLFTTETEPIPVKEIKQNKKFIRIKEVSGCRSQIARNFECTNLLPKHRRIVELCEMHLGTSILISSDQILIKILLIPIITCKIKMRSFHLFSSLSLFEKVTTPPSIATGVKKESVTGFCTQSEMLV